MGLARQHCSVEVLLGIHIEGLARFSEAGDPQYGLVQGIVEGGAGGPQVGLDKRQ